MEEVTDPELILSLLNTAASMEMLTDELDRISTHSAGSPHFNHSRDSLHSSLKYDSAFDSHFSEDTSSVNSAPTSHPVESSMLPSSIITPPLPYRVIESSSPLAHQHRANSRHSVSHPASHPASHSANPNTTYPLSSSSVKSYSIGSHQLSSTLTKPSVLPSAMEPQLVYIDHHPPSLPPSLPPATIRTPVEEATRHADEDEGDSTLREEWRSDAVSNSSSSSSSTEAGCVSNRSSASSTEGCVSNTSTPRAVQRWQTSTPAGKQQETLSPPARESKSLPPLASLVYPSSESDSSDLDHFGQMPTPRATPIPQRRTQFPKQGMLFYQDNLTPQQTPRHTGTATPSKTSPSHLLPNRYRDSGSANTSTNTTSNNNTSNNNTNTSTGRKLPARRASLLQRLKRNKGSFKETGLVKRHQPVRRSFSDRITYHIRKGWIDYEQDLDFVSLPTHPRAVGRMIDKKEGRYHVVQLFRPPNGRYGIYISQTGHRKGVFVSRFADSNASKFYCGLISPGDEIVRVNGKNIRGQSVDHVYDLMTESDSVIFTVIPVTSRSDW